MAKLHFRYGAMNGGKSTQLIQTAFNYEENGGLAVVVKPMADTKGGKSVVSRAGNLSRNVDIVLAAEDDLLALVKSHDNSGASIILIDEAQFITPKQAEAAHRISAELNIPVIAFGLRCDFRNVGFPGASRLLELADSIEEITTICANGCERKGRQNFRTLDGEFVFDGDQVSIDDQDRVKYVSLCKTCATQTRRAAGLDSI